jgi:hypothetical protein
MGQKIWQLQNKRKLYYLHIKKKKKKLCQLMIFEHQRNFYRISKGKPRPKLEW